MPPAVQPPAVEALVNRRDHVYVENLSVPDHHCPLFDSRLASLIAAHGVITRPTLRAKILPVFYLSASATPHCPRQPYMLKGPGTTKDFTPRKLVLEETLHTVRHSALCCYTRANSPPGWLIGPIVALPLAQWTIPSRTTGCLHLPPLQPQARRNV
jgi:hypothetical protein